MDVGAVGHSPDMRTNTSLTTVCVVLCLFLAACTSWEYPSPALESKVETSVAVFKTTSDALAATGGAYVGQIIEVTGTVEHIVNKGGAPGLILSGGVICGFGEKQKTMVGTLSKGDRITLRGIYKDAPSGTLGPYMTPCIRVP